MNVFRIFNTLFYYIGLLLGAVALYEGVDNLKYWVIGLMVMSFISRGAIQVAARWIIEGRKENANFEIISHMLFTIALVVVSLRVIL